MSPATEVRIRNLSSRKVSALRREAKREGVTVEQYVKDLIEDRLEAVQRARTTSWAEITKPFQEAFKGVSEAELDAMVDAARSRHHQKQARAKRR